GWRRCEDRFVGGDEPCSGRLTFVVAGKARVGVCNVTSFSFVQDAVATMRREGTTIRTAAPVTAVVDAVVANLVVVDESVATWRVSRPRGVLELTRVDRTRAISLVRGRGLAARAVCDRVVPAERVRGVGEADASSARTVADGVLRPRFDTPIDRIVDAMWIDWQTAISGDGTV